MNGFIYKITNPNGKVYIGQSINLIYRIKSYKYLKCKGQPKIFNSLKKYGFDSHNFEVIEKITENDINTLFYLLNEFEVFWINEFDSYKNGLNCNIGGKNAPCSDETKLKISKSKMGSIVSQETREKLSMINSGRPSNRKGAKLSDYHISILVACNIGRKPKSCKKVKCSNGVIYNSISEASKILNIQRTNICFVFSGKRKTAGGLKFNYYHD